MSDEHKQPVCPHPEAVGMRWGDAISEERKVRLRDVANQQREWAAQPEATRGDSAFKKRQLTGADVFWLAEQEHGDDRVGIVSALHLEGANLSNAHLERADLSWAHLEGAFLWSAHLEGAGLGEAHLEEAHLHGASFDKTSYLNDAVLTGASFDQVMFDNTNLTVVDWSLVTTLGDEVTARNPKLNSGKFKVRAVRLDEYKSALRANRVLAVALRAQGLNEDADRFAYRAQVLQRQVLRRQRHWLRYFGPLLLDTISGHGYRPLRAFVAYAVVILAFMGLYLLNSQFAAPHLSWNEALVLSMSSFHGRGFFNPGIGLGDTYAELAAAEAFVGLFIEITFIATFTQRFFAR